MSRLFSGSLLSLNATEPPAFYPLSLHAALPIFVVIWRFREGSGHGRATHEKERHSLKMELTWTFIPLVVVLWIGYRSEEHTSELQSQSNLVCRLLLEKKKPYANRHSSRVTSSSF